MRALLRAPSGQPLLTLADPSEMRPIAANGRACLTPLGCIAKSQCHKSLLESAMVCNVGSSNGVAGAHRSCIAAPHIARCNASLACAAAIAHARTRSDTAPQCMHAIDDARRLPNTARTSAHRPQAPLLVVPASPCLALHFRHQHWALVTCELVIVRASSDDPTRSPEERSPDRSKKKKGTPEINLVVAESSGPRTSGFISSPTELAGALCVARAGVARTAYKGGALSTSTWWRFSARTLSCHGRARARRGERLDRRCCEC